METGNERVISLGVSDTPLGQMVAGATADGICLLEFTDNGVRLKNEIAAA